MDDVKITFTPHSQPIDSQFIPPATGNSQVTDYQKVKLPMPREFNGKKYYGAADVAKIIGVTKKTVWTWQTELYMGAPLFTADERAHDGRYLYDVERVMQLKAVYHKDWMRGGYEENLTNQHERIEQAEQLFDLLYNKIPAVNFAYLWTKQDKKTYPFAIADTKHAMVKKAIELSDSGFDVYHCVNPVNVKPSGKRGDESVVAYQTACIVDIDIASDAHKQSDLAPSFDVAKSYLPFQPSILINSGYGLHAYYAFDSPIAITDENREQIKQRNELLLDVVRSRSNGKKIDGVGDLPRILRTPGTFNYKLGKDNPPLCHIVEVNDLCFTPEQLDEKLNTFAPTISAELSKKYDKSARNVDDKDLDIFRARRMLEFISPSTLTYDDWIAVGIALKNIGCNCSDWEQWSTQDERFKEGECQAKWDGFKGEGYDFGTLYHFAAPNGYDAKETFREWKKILQRTAQCAKISSDRNILAMDGSLHYIYEPHKGGTISMFASHDNKGSPKNQGETYSPNSPLTPSPRPYQGQKYFTTAQVCEIIGVDKKTVRNWREQRIFVEDILDHNGVYLYLAERVYQLKEVYRRDWETAWRGDDSTIRADFIGTKKKIPSCPVDLKIPYGFTFSKHGISFVVRKNKVDKETGEKKVEYLPVANTPIIPTKIFFNPVTKTDEYEIAILSRGSWRFAEMTAPELYDSKALTKLASYGALVLDFKKLSHYFAEIISLNDIPQIKAYDRTGWTDDTCTEFIYPHEGAQYLLRRAGFDFDAMFKPRGSKEKFLDVFRKIDDCGTVARVAIGHMLAAVLVRPLHLPNLQAHVFGNSGIGKTPLLRFGSSIFGNPNGGYLSRTFTASFKNQLEMAAALCDLPIVLEEKETADAKKEEGLQQSVYDYQQGVANQAQKRDGTSRDVKKFFGSRISDGESPLLNSNSKKGGFKRVLPLHCEFLFDNDFAESLYEFTNENYALFGWDWIRYVQEHKGLIEKTYNENKAYINRQERKINPTWCTTLAISLAAYQHFRENVIDINYSFGRADLESDMYKLCYELPLDTDLDDYTRAIDALNSFINAHPYNFSYDMENPANSSVIDFIGSKNTSATYGHKFIDGEVGFYRTELVEILEKKLGFASGKKLIDDFADNGLLRHNKGDVSFRVFIGNPATRKRVILFKDGVFDISGGDVDTDADTE